MVDANRALNKHFRDNGLRDHALFIAFEPTALWGRFRWRYRLGMMLLRAGARVLRVGLETESREATDAKASAAQRTP